MTAIINASTSSGITMTADNSGVMKLQSNGVSTNALAWGSYAYSAGAAPTIRSAYNISSITRNSPGNYTLAFTASSSDANYTICVSATNTSAGASCTSYALNGNKTTSSFILITQYVSSTGGSSTAGDYGIDFAVFGN